MNEIERRLLSNQRLIIQGLYTSSGTDSSVVDALIDADIETRDMLQDAALESDN